MNISRMRVAVRPMSTSQAVDLGTMIARYWFVPLWKIWVGMAWPFFVLLYLPFLIFNNEQNSIFSLALVGSVLFWWFKPIYEKPMLSWLGYAMFDDEQSVQSTIKHGFKTARQYSFILLLKKRLSPYRHLSLPILQLEKPETAQLNKRLKILSRGQGSGLAWHLLILWHIEALVPFAIILIVSLLIPTSLMSTETLFSYLEYSSGWENVAMALFYFLSASIIAPFFVAGGFAVYLTKRCLLEGWDVELIFKNLALRYQADKKDLLQAPTGHNIDPNQKQDTNSTGRAL